MEKLSAAEWQEILAEVPSVLRALVEENRELKEKVAGYERKEHAEKVASLMVERGIEPNVGYQEKVASLLRDPQRDLRVMEEAVRLEVPALKLASVSDDQYVGNSGSRLEAYLLGHEG